MNDQTVSRKTFDEVMVPCFSPAPFVPDRGEGSRVWDTEAAIMSTSRAASP